MVQVILNDGHLDGVLGEALATCRRRLFISTADLKDVHIPQPGARRARSLLKLLTAMADRGIEIHLLHSGVPSGPALQELKADRPASFVIRRCMRIHAKAVIVDGRQMYLGSANLTGAGLGAKSARRRNFEAGLWTDQVDLIDPVLDMLEGVFSGDRCADCGRREHCPVPLEEPARPGDSKPPVPA